MLENFLNLEKKLMNYYIHNKFTLLDNTFFEILQKKNKKKYQQKEYSVSLLKNIQKLKHFRWNILIYDEWWQDEKEQK